MRSRRRRMSPGIYDARRVISPGRTPSSPVATGVSLNIFRFSFSLILISPANKCKVSGRFIGQMERGRLAKKLVYDLQFWEIFGRRELVTPTSHFPKTESLLFRVISRVSIGCLHYLLPSKTRFTPVFRLYL